jgi:hypothetical protein
MHPFAELQMDVLVFPSRIAEQTLCAGLFVVTDDFTGWSWIELLRNQSAETLVSALERRVLREFPRPQIIRSDGHPSFRSAEMASLLLDNSIEHRLSAPYNAREHGGVERMIGVVQSRLRSIFAGDIEATALELERALRFTPSEAHLGRSPFENVYGVRAEPLGRLSDPAVEGSLSDHIAARDDARADLLHTMLRHRIDRQHRRERATGPLPTFEVGQPVMLIRPPADKMTHGAVGPYVVVSVGEHDAYYSVALLGPDGQPTGLPTRAAAGQLRPFDMSRTTPAAEWRRLVEQEFGDDEEDALFPTRRIADHRASQRADSSDGDLEFLVVWITNRGDVTTWEPVHFLKNNEHFKDYIRSNRLQAAVLRQARRERARLGREG